jgi:hypothetical protein
MSKNSGDNTNPINQRYETALNDYNTLRDQYAGNAGYQNAINQSSPYAEQMTRDSFNTGMKNGTAMTNAVNQAGFSGARDQTNASTASAINKGAAMQDTQNAQAQKYAGRQAANAAAGAQNQATTAARAAGMNKAQAAMMGSQQNANAYQNAYGNAYSQQLGNAQSNQNTQLANYNSAFENNANRMNNNMMNQQQMANANAQYQQGMAQQSGQAALNAQGNVLGAQQQEGQNVYNREYGNRGFWTGILTSDERLKNYRECTKKVVMRTPSKLKVTIKGDK